MILHGLGRVAYLQGDQQAAREHLEEGLALARELGDAWLQALLLTFLGRVTTVLGDHSAAQASQEESLAIKRHLGMRRAMGLSLTNLGQLARLAGDRQRAWAHLRESLLLMVEGGEYRHAPSALEACAGLLAAEGQAAPAARLFGAAEALRERVGRPLPPVQRRQYERDVARARAALDPAAFATARAAGRALTPDEAVALALSAAEAAAGGAAPTSAAADDARACASGAGPSGDATAAGGARTSAGALCGQPAPPLTAREREVVALLARGLSNQEIATRLVVSEHTVHRHVANVLTKLGVPSRAAVAALAVREGWV
jgi:non-specific serine/threonine protein kinase